MSKSNAEKEVAKLDPNGPDYEIFVKALRHFHGLTAEKLKAFVERNGLHGHLVFLLPQKRNKTVAKPTKN
jgi:hypothetical protein